jgi:uncharacterized protein (DUF58 family)
MAEMTEKPDYLRILDAETIAKLSHLEITARQVVEGFISGLHRSPYRGFSVEFAEHREYSPGDEVRQIDWRVYARSDRFYIKQYEEETNVRAYLLVDSSGSMQYKGEHSFQGLSKFEYAQHIAAALAHLMLRQSDAVGMVTFDKSIRRYIPPRSAGTHLHVLLEELARTEPGEETSLAAIFHDLAERIKRRGLIIIISDFFDDVNEIIEAMHHFRYRHHEVMVVHVMADEELSFPFRRWLEFRDLERNYKLMLDPSSLREEYLRNLHTHLEELAHGCGQLEIDYLQFNTADPYDSVLAGYLGRRAMMK